MLTFLNAIAVMVAFLPPTLHITSPANQLSNTHIIIIALLPGCPLVPALKPKMTIRLVSTVIIGTKSSRTLLVHAGEFHAEAVRVLLTLRSNDLPKWYAVPA